MPLANNYCETYGRNHAERYNIVALLDDDEAKIGRQIHRVPIVASPEVLQDLIYRWDIDLVLIAVPSASEQQMQRLVTLCEDTGVEFRTLPGLHELVSGVVRLTDVREVRIDDLLGRDPVKLDWHRIKDSLHEKNCAGDWRGWFDWCRVVSAISVSVRRALGIV